MNDNYRKINEVPLTHPEFPYLIAERGIKHSSYFSISRMDKFMVDDPTLFYIVGSEMNKRDVPGGEYVLQVRHSFARDEEGDQAYISQFILKSLQMESAYDNCVRYSAWLTEAHFYPEGFQDNVNEEFNPFKDAVDAGDRDDNSGYPYLPPRVTFGESLTFPVQVEVTLYHNLAEKKLLPSLDKTMVRHAEAREERKAKREAERVARAKRKEEARLEREAYLLTEEGQVEFAEETMFDYLRELVRTDADPSEVELDLLRNDAEVWVKKQDALMVSRLSAAKAQRNWKIKNVGRREWLVVADATVDALVDSNFGA